MHIAILGSGPAGLLAAHAANQNKCHFDVYSLGEKSQLYGSQYLHEPIPGVTDFANHVDVEYRLEGSLEDYRRKVYGATWDGNVSPGTLEDRHKAWDIRSAYDILWETYAGNVHPVKIDRQFMFWDGLEKYDMVLSTIPRTIWRKPGDQFFSVEIWAIGDTYSRKIPLRPKSDNTVFCDGTRDVGWYRLSQIFGYATAEWPGHTRPPIKDVAVVRKPLGFKSEEAPDFIHLGRYGKWQKGILTTDAYNEALKVTA